MTLSYLRLTPSSSLTSISLSSTPYKQITIAPARVKNQLMNLENHRQSWLFLWYDLKIAETVRRVRFSWKYAINEMLKTSNEPLRFPQTWSENKLPGRLRRGWDLHWGRAATSQSSPHTWKCKRKSLIVIVFIYLHYVPVGVPLCTIVNIVFYCVMFTYIAFQ